MGKKGKDWQKEVEDFACRLEAIDYDSLPISDYNKEYICRLRPAFRFFLKIYAACFRKGLHAIGRNAGETTLVDYGGGSGFLSMFAKTAGFGKVIYVDHNPLSVDAVKILSAEIGIGPEVVLEGSSTELLSWCRSHQEKPQLLISTDVIEHVYDLSPFFQELTAMDGIYMLFTTGSTPYNLYWRRKLETRMRQEERREAEQPDYFTKRYRFIRANYPALPEEEVKQWACKTRGLILADIPAVVEGKRTYRSPGRYNTCDPETGNWAERILPFGTYRALLAPYGYKVRFDKGFYNEERPNPLFSLVCRFINTFIRLSGKAGFAVAPFIFIRCGNKGRSSRSPFF